MSAPVFDDINSETKHGNSLGGVSGAHSTSSLLTKFLDSHKELKSYRNGRAVKVDGHTLSIAAVTAAARYNATVDLDVSPQVKASVMKSRAVIADKVDNGTSIYGVSTGFGGSADTRTDKPLHLGQALLQHQHVGILPSSDRTLDVLPLLSPMASTSMPESWVRGAMLVRMNSLIRGHSGVRWELLEKINELLRANITPVVPLRSSISASGDLSSLSYIAGTLIANPSIRVFDGPRKFGARKMISSKDALALHGIKPISLVSKEGLGILNGTAFSASVASLALNDATHLALLAQICTALGTEALSGTLGNYAPFIHATARPHPGQVESASHIWNLLQGSKLASTHKEEVSISQDKYSLRQDRYPLRTAPQFLGPQIEDILSALSTVIQECNSTTDNPLIDGETGQVHHGGNFQAMAVSNAMEKTRLALHHIGKLLFAQSAELVNPAMNHGLPPSLAASDPSLNYHGKGIDIATAAYVAELGYLANPVTTHIQSAEMHNQAVNSLALISARVTVSALEVLTMLMSSYLYLLCQAVDLRALRRELNTGLQAILSEELAAILTSQLSSQEIKISISSMSETVQNTLDKTSTMDAVDQMKEVATACIPALIEAVPRTNDALSTISQFRTNVSSKATKLMGELRSSYLSGRRGSAPASPYLGKTRAVYEYIRITLGVRMHGAENFSHFSNGLGVDDVTIGQNITTIFEAIRDGKLQDTVADLFDVLPRSKL
ncbi:phenylalanine ammonia-lyase [Guyanagaster necrorhizus]|uniref:Phenylalanine ammonia-lyase n=1 Tax=Guyanagaster necrorhizus TaxID=856835 RepID=A0A9P7VFZ4_9AGAR|nr:phenylalanine ammonia-lyase [Guyanagaster necrorhizus MCA 3950]KAG7440004.1 phenylalanine ammonia-lyase [Guyanagaster necrorhizus MCA 3950]